MSMETLGFFGAMGISYGLSYAYSLNPEETAYFRHSCYDFSKDESLKVRSGNGNFETAKKPERKHALVIVGEENRHKNTAELVIDGLLESGFRSNDIYILEGRSNSTRHYRGHIYPSSKNNLRDFAEHLSKFVTEDDSFFLYVGTHGYRRHGIRWPITQSEMILEDGTILNETELKELLSFIRPNHSVNYFNSCFSGGFARRFGKGRSIGISTVRPNKACSAYMGDDYVREYGDISTVFSLYFFSALARRTDLKNPSIEEIFDYAARGQNETQEPGFLKNTPTICYDKINPAELRL